MRREKKREGEGEEKKYIGAQSLLLCEHMSNYQKKNIETLLMSS